MYWSKALVTASSFLSQNFSSVLRIFLVSLPSWISARVRSMNCLRRTLAMRFALACSSSPSAASRLSSAPSSSG